MKLIDKDALVAEIENYKNCIGEDGEHCSLVVGKHKGQRMASEHFLSFIDTLEVKEVDTEQLDKLLDWWKEVTTDYSAYKVKEVDLDYIKDELDRVVKIYKPDGDFGWGTLYNIATHFFELGLKAQRGE